MKQETETIREQEAAPYREMQSEANGGRMIGALVWVIIMAGGALMAAAVIKAVSCWFG